VWIPLRVGVSLGARALVFGTILGASSGSVPYLVFFAVGLAAWELFASTLMFGTRSLEINGRYLKRIYVPRLVVLLAAVAPGLLWATVYGLLLAIVLGYYLVADGVFHLHLGADTLLAIGGLALIVLLALAIGLWTSVFGGLGRRDPRFIVRQVLHVWFYLTPVIYPLSLVPASIRDVMSANPLTAPMEMVHRGLLGDGDIQTSGLIVTIATIVVVGALGLRFFDSSESRALDRL
jgi:lipopolysaccharide transport system permease protein